LLGRNKIMAGPEESTIPVKQDGRKLTAEAKPLIFISHDNRDAELAEAFSKLLKSVSTGMLKSFRSSDHQGKEGFQYGDEWYKKLMERLDDASDVVCLFTKRSLNRPWILFEAGVAKGKKGTPVHGVALGVSLSQVSTGPFYQFANCQDDEKGLTKLVIELLERLPNAEPEREAIGFHVKNFKSSVDAILAKIDGEEHETEINQSESEESSAAKLFEEIKVMVRDLPSYLEERMSDDMGPFKGKRYRRMHPMMIEEIIHVMSPKSPDPYLGVLIISSFFRDEIPWFYELGLEVYRKSRGNRSKQAAQDALTRFRHAVELIFHGPFSEEFMFRSKEMHMMFRELEHMLDTIMDRFRSSEDVPDFHD